MLWIVIFCMQYRQINNEPIIKIWFLLLPSGTDIVQYYGLLWAVNLKQNDTLFRHIWQLRPYFLGVIFYSLLTFSELCTSGSFLWRIKDKPQVVLWCYTLHNALLRANRYVSFRPSYEQRTKFALGCFVIQLYYKRINYCNYETWITCAKEARNGMR